MTSKSCAICHDHVITGSRYVVPGLLARRLGQIIRYADYFKIGITGDLKARAYSHGRDGWTKLTVVYESSSRANVRHVERELVDRFSSRFPDKTWHACGGGGGPNHDGPKQFVYIIT